MTDSNTLVYDAAVGLGASPGVAARVDALAAMPGLPVAPHGGPAVSRRETVRSTYAPEGEQTAKAAGAVDKEVAKVVIGHPGLAGSAGEEAAGDALDVIPEKYRAAVRRAFEGTPIAETIQEDRIVYRRWGGKAAETGSPWYSTAPYERPGNARRYLALPEGNTAENLTAFKIPKGTTILRGKAASMAGEPGFGAKAVGGGQQIYLPDAGRPIKVEQSS
jgi:hypothetical protein